jgi:hypothetical protein
MPHKRTGTPWRRNLVLSYFHGGPSYSAVAYDSGVGNFFKKVVLRFQMSQRSNLLSCEKKRTKLLRHGVVREKNSLRFFFHGGVAKKFFLVLSSGVNLVRYFGPPPWN